MLRSVTYFGPGLAPTVLAIRAMENGLARLSRPDSEEIIVSGVPLTDTPTEGCAVPLTEEAPAPKPAKKPKAD